MKINAVDPGYTATDLNHHSGPQTVTQGADAIVNLATIGTDGPTGTSTTGTASSVGSDAPGHDARQLYARGEQP